MPLFGLKGQALATLRTFLVVVPGFLLFGYNQSNLGGLLDYPSFNKHFPEIDTANTEGAQKAHNAKIQGVCHTAVVGIVN